MVDPLHTAPDTSANEIKCEADVLLAAKLDRVSRSVLDFTNLMAHADRRGWRIVVLDVNVDTTTASGELMATVVTFA